MRAGLRRLGRVAATPPVRLGLVRALVGVYTLAHLLPQRSALREVARTDPELFEPVGPVRAVRRPLPPRVADVLNDATLVSTALFTLGVRHRLVGPLHSALLTWTLSYRNSWSMIYHIDNALVAHTVLLGASPAADAVSLPALRRGGSPAPHPRYGWPLQLMNAASAVTYLLAGVAKVAGPSGWAWVGGDAMRRQVAVDGVRKELFGLRVSPAAHALYRHRRLFTGMAVGSLLLELAAPLGLLNRRLGRLWVLGTYGMHWGVRVIMGIPFPYQLSGVSFASWFDVERPMGFFRRVRGVTDKH
jgi:hypothetical protein